MEKLKHNWVEDTSLPEYYIFYYYKCTMCGYIKSTHKHLHKFTEYAVKDIGFAETKYTVKYTSDWHKNELSCSEVLMENVLR